MIGCRLRGAILPALVLVWLVGSVAIVEGCRKDDARKRPLVCHVGGTMRPVMSKLANIYREETGREVEINSAGSGELLAHIEAHKEGDVYICHDPFLDVLMKRGLGRDGWTVGELTPVIVVRKGNPKGIRGIGDLTNPDLSLVLTDFRKSTLGWLLPTIFKRAGVDFETLRAQENVQTFRKGGQAANVVKSGNADAAIVWNAVAHLRLDGLDAVPIPSEHLPVPGVDAVTTATRSKSTYFLTPVRVTVATLTCSKRPEAAREFAEFVASERAANVFEEFGFTTTPTRINYRDGKKVD